MSLTGALPAEQLRISLTVMGLPSECRCLLADLEPVGLGGKLNWILGICDVGRFRAECAGLLPGLVLYEQSEGVEPSTELEPDEENELSTEGGGNDDFTLDAAIFAGPVFQLQR